MRHIIARVIIALILIFGLVQNVSAATNLQILRAETVLKSYNSPMQGSAKELIEIAQDYNLDWTLLIAIAGTESSFGKRMPANCTNPYGWGIYGDHKLCFESFSDAARAVATGLTTRYNTTSLEAIGRTYNKVSTESWIKHTQFFMNKIKNASIPVSNLPIEL